MRILASCFLGVFCTLAGCCSQESASNSEAKTTVSAKVCVEDDCCSSVTRAGLLKQRLKKKVEAEQAPSSDPSPE
jgi:hypothetical protein